MIFGFFVMGILAYRTYTASMPMPEKVVTHTKYEAFVLVPEHRAGLFRSHGPQNLGARCPVAHWPIRLSRRPRRLGLPAGPMAMADVVRPRAPRDAASGETERVQQLPGQIDLHHIERRPRGQPRGRSVARPCSEAGRFHRGIAWSVAGLALLMPLSMLIGKHSAADVLVLVAPR